MQMFFKLKIRIKYFFFHVQNDWEIGFSRISIEKFIHSKKNPKIQWFKMPKNVFWADPFGIRVKDKYFIFYEEFRKKENYGVINCIEMDFDFNIIKNGTVIDEKTHFSFPQIISSDGEKYMLPETCNKEKLSLYRCISFPWVWEEDLVLINKPCVDSILYQKNNIWYLFYSKASDNNRGYLRMNSNLKSNWEDCQEYLINNNSENSRNGGQIIDLKNESYRISQNCSNIYGEKIGIHKITEISPDSYSEVSIKEISLKKGSVTCCHTLNECGDLTLIDRRRERLYLKSFAEIYQSIMKKTSYNKT